MINSFLVVLIGVIAGGVTGIVLAFSMAATHNDVNTMGGVQPKENFILSFLTQSTTELNFSKVVLLIIIVLGWFGLWLAPTIAIQWFPLENNFILLIAYICFAGTWIISQYLGIQIWGRPLTQSKSSSAVFPWSTNLIGLDGIVLLPASIIYILFLGYHLAIIHSFVNFGILVISALLVILGIRTSAALLIGLGTLGILVISILTWH